MLTTLYINFSDAQGQITLVLVVVSGRNSSKLSCMSSLPARMRLIDTKVKELECSQDFSHYKSMGIFSRRSRAANSALLCPFWSNFELVRDVMNVLVTCKYEEDQNLMQPFPHPNDGSDKISLRLSLVAEIFKFENVYRQTHTQTHTHTDDSSTGIL